MEVVCNSVICDFFLPRNLILPSQGGKKGVGGTEEGRKEKKKVHIVLICFVVGFFFSTLNCILNVNITVIEYPK